MWLQGQLNLIAGLVSVLDRLDEGAGSAAAPAIDSSAGAESESEGEAAPPSGSGGGGRGRAARGGLVELLLRRLLFPEACQIWERGASGQHNMEALEAAQALVCNDARVRGAALGLLRVRGLRKGGRGQG